MPCFTPHLLEYDLGGEWKELGVSVLSERSPACTVIVTRVAEPPEQWLCSPRVRRGKKRGAGECGVVRGFEPCPWFHRGAHRR
jgi:hypothetical protein